VRHPRLARDEPLALQPGLVEALNGLGDKLLLSDVARNMNLVSLVKGQDIATLFAEIVGGTKLARTIETMLPATSSSGGNDGQTSGG